MQTYKQINKQTYKDIGIHTNQRTDMHTEMQQEDSQTEIHIDIADKCAAKKYRTDQTDKTDKTDRQINRQAGTTNKHTYTQTKVQT